MAARQDQSLQVFLIVSVLFAVVFAALSYFFYRGYSEASLRADQAQTALDEARTTQRNLSEEKQEFQQMMGFDPADSSTDVKSAFEEDMKRFAGAFDENRRFYRDVLEYVHEESQKTAAREATAKEQIKDLKERLLAVENEKEQQVQQFKQQMEKAQEDAALQREQFSNDRKQLETTQNDLQSQVDQQRETFEGELADSEAKIDDLEGKTAKLQRALENALGRIPRSVEQLEVADGRISWVNQNGTVWINLGQADGLRRQVTFSVFDTNRKEDVGAKRKATIEVTRVLADHMAEARVTRDDAVNPILTGDLIYSQVWSRGDNLHFALAGLLDADGDGRNDVQLLRDLIQLNGGVVDAYVADDGKIEGQMSVNTRYLVLGKYPEDAVQSDLRKGWDDMNAEASTLGVETITLSEFLNQIGYVPQERVVALDGSGRSSNVPPRTPRDMLPTDDANLFRPRSPDRLPGTTPY